jgi:chromosome segregation ATPase
VDADSLQSASRRLVELATLQASRDGALENSHARLSSAEGLAEALRRQLAQLAESHAALQAEAEELRRSDGRTRTDLTYLKQVTVKLLQSLEAEEADALSLVVGTLLHFSRAEMAACQDAADARQAARAKASQGVLPAASGYVASWLGYST